jgi:hypothetical protein
LTFIVISLCCLVFAQIPELKVNAPNAADIENANGIDKARLYFASGNLMMAEALLYAELEKDNLSPADFLLFANTLIADSKPALAKEFYKEYISQTKQEGTSEDEMVTSLFANTAAKFKPRFSHNTLDLVNPKMYNNRMYSAGIDGRLYSYNIDCDGNIGNRKEELGNLTDMDFGSISFYNNGTMAVASLIQRSSNTSALYLFRQKRGKWTKPSKIFSKEDGNFAFPFIDESTNQLYFSSDKEGGFGGYDIYVANIVGKSITDPVNLGNRVNTSLNEINPNKTAKWLYFSSNGHVSNGGYDIYQFSILDDFNSVLVNGKDFNSVSNELCVIPISDEMLYAYGQNNTGENSFSMYGKTSDQKLITGQLVDSSGTAIPNAALLYTALHGNAYAVTDSEGNYSFAVNSETKTLVVTAMAEGYKTASIAIMDQEIHVLKAIEPVYKEVIKEVIREVKESDYTEAVNANVNENGEVATSNTEPYIIPEHVDIAKISSHSSPNQPDRGFYYIIIGSTNDYASAFDFWQKWAPQFHNLEILEYENSLYRIGFYGGSTETQVRNLFTESKKKKADMWLLKPKS